MPKIYLFVEDFAHEAVIGAILKKLLRELQIHVELVLLTASGGHGKVISELSVFIRDIQKGMTGLPDLLIVCIDSNCSPVNEVKKDILDVFAGNTSLRDKTIIAIPEPHVERWLLLDSAAFKKVLGKGCSAPDKKCDKNRYKRLFIEAIIAAGVQPLVGGIEHAEAIINELNLKNIPASENTFRDFISDLMRALKTMK